MRTSTIYSYHIKCLFHKAGGRLSLTYAKHVLRLDGVIKSLFFLSSFVLRPLDALNDVQEGYDSLTGNLPQGAHVYLEELLFPFYQRQEWYKHRTEYRIFVFLLLTVFRDAIHIYFPAFLEFFPTL